MSARQCLSRLARQELEKNFAAQNFDGGASNADVNYPVILLRRADKNAAGPLHLDALFDEHALVGSGDTMGDHPCRRATCGGPSCGILAVVEEHTGMQTGCGIDGSTGDEVEKLSTRFLQIFCGPLNVDANLLNHGQ